MDQSIRANVRAFQASHRATWPMDVMRRSALETRDRRR
jgi:hypothetical protein